ncbi:hypothetical protein [Bifidobacterium stellenboschense]|uniref:hypothetical protein n=1 Tax=Bifidobacterium stellenboschense TaxID=762211 RepID=UPI0012EB17CB|nr:hypothetical protein [Bifidobacterium stellenboschense]
MDETASNVENSKATKSLWITRGFIHIISMSYPHFSTSAETNDRKPSAGVIHTIHKPYYDYYLRVLLSHHHPERHLPRERSERATHRLE